MLPGLTCLGNNSRPTVIRQSAASLSSYSYGPYRQVQYVSTAFGVHELLTDCKISVVYTSEYQFVNGGDKQLRQKVFKFYHATFTPDANPPTAAMTALVDMHDYAFHLHMYALAEELDYDAIKSTAHTKLVQLLVNVHNETPSAIEDVISATFNPLGSPSRICKDEDGILQQLVVAAVLAHEFKEWNETEQKAFSDLIQGPELTNFRNTYTMIKGANQDLIEMGDTARSLAAERKLGMERRRAAKINGTGNVDQGKLFVGNGSPLGVLSARTNTHKGKFKSKYVEKRSVATVAKANREEDMEMEMD
jgi:hypothetical protein